MKKQKNLQQPQLTLQQIIQANGNQARIKVVKLLIYLIEIMMEEKKHLQYLKENNILEVGGSPIPRINWETLTPDYTMYME